MLHCQQQFQKLSRMLLPTNKYFLTASEYKLLASYPDTNNETEQFWHRLIGTVVGSSLFYLLTLILPTSLHSLLEPIGGFCLGFCTDYRYKTAINCFGAFMIASSIYGIHGAVLLKSGTTS